MSSRASVAAGGRWRTGLGHASVSAFRSRSAAEGVGGERAASGRRRIETHREGAGATVEDVEMTPVIALYERLGEADAIMG